MSAAYITFDQLVSSLLLSKELPDHWYIQCMKLALDCFRELSFDTLLISHEETVEAVDGEFPFPCGFVDAIGVWALDDPNKRRLAMIDINWKKQKIKIGWNGVGAKDGKYVIEFIKNGLECNAATKIHPYAQKTIEAYIEWKSSPNRNNPRSPEGVIYGNEYGILRGRLSDLTPEVLEMIAERRTHTQYNHSQPGTIDLLP